MAPFIFMGVVLTVGILVFIVYRSTRRRAAVFAASLGFKDMKSGQTYQAQAHDKTFFYQYFAGSRNTPSYFRIWINCPSRGAFRIGRETAIQRFFKGLGITVEVQTGDSGFDRDYFINTDSVAFTRAFFSSADRRQGIKELFRLNFKYISLNGSTLEAKITPFRFSEGLDKARVESAVDLLAALGEDMPEDFYESRIIGTPAWKLQRIITYSLSISVLVLGIAALVWGNMHYPPLDRLEIFKDSLGYSVPALLMFIVFSVYMLKGRSSSHVDLLSNLGLALIGFPLAFYSGMVTCNGFLDQSPTNYHVAMVTHKYMTKSKDSTYYHVNIKSWRNNHVMEEIKVNRNSYLRIHRGTTHMGITTRPGYLGYEWLVAYRVVARE